ncbi:MAG TPA: hypothetical protein VG345_15050 [Bryobacteraceae bacterium]|nr:hypothetical protein [Bryobacteraceae bacterium]
MDQTQSTIGGLQTVETGFGAAYELRNGVTQPTEPPDADPASTVV